MNRMFCTPEDLIAQVDKEVLLQRADMDELPPWPQMVDETEPPQHDTITPAIVNASAEIAGYLRRRYALPETPEETPATLRKLCVDITIYNIFSRSGIEQDKTHSHSIIVKRYDDAIAYLNLVADNKRDVDGLKGAGTEDEEEEIDDGSGGAYIPLFRA